MFLEFILCIFLPNSDLPGQVSVKFNVIIISKSESVRPTQKAFKIQSIKLMYATLPS